MILPGKSGSEQLLQTLRSAGYEADAAASPPEVMEAVQNIGVDLLLLDANVTDLDCCQVLSDVKGSAATAAIRVILLSDGGAGERSRGLDLGADDVLSRPWEPAELLARVRAQLRSKRAFDELNEKTRIAEEGQEIAHTAFQAVAVTEKMTRDAVTLGRSLKIGVTSVLALAVVMAALYVLFWRSASKETRRAYAAIAQLERSVTKQQDLVAQARKMRDDVLRSGGSPEEKQRLESSHRSCGRSSPAAIPAMSPRCASSSPRPTRGCVTSNRRGVSLSASVA